MQSLVPKFLASILILKASFVSTKLVYTLQVRMKAVCVLESILRRNDVEKFLVVSSYFSENKDAVVGCSESPQTSLREKANKVSTTSEIRMC